MKEIYLTYDGNQHRAVLNLNTVRNYSREMGMKTVNEFAESFSDFEADDISFDALERIGKLFLCAIREGARLDKAPCPITLEDVFVIFEDQKEAMMSLMSESLLSDSEPENPQRPGAKTPG